MLTPILSPEQCKLSEQRGLSERGVMLRSAHSAKQNFPPDEFTKLDHTTFVALVSSSW